MSEYRPFYKFLRNSSNSKDMNVDGSSTAVEFEYEVPTGKTSLVVRMAAVIRDGTIQLNQFGGLAALSNGLKIESIAADNLVQTDFLDGSTIKALDHFAFLDDSEFLSEPGTGDDSWFSHWMIAKDSRPYQMTAGERFRMTVQDNLTGLTEFSVMLHGLESV